MIRVVHVATCMLVSSLLAASTGILTYFFLNAQITELKAEISRLSAGSNSSGEGQEPAILILRGEGNAGQYPFLETEETSVDFNDKDKVATEATPDEKFGRRKLQLRRRNLLEDYFELVSDDARGGCLVVTNSNTRDGTQLTLGTCHSSNPESYQWRHDSDGLFHSRLDDDKCMQAGHGGSPGHATRMRLYTCDKDDELQKFTYHDEERIELTNTNLCVVFRGVNGHLDRDPIILKSCDESERQDNWIYPATPDRGYRGDQDGDPVIPSLESRSCDNVESFMKEFLAELQTLTDETKRFDLLTKELGTIASFLDTRRQLQSWLAGVAPSQNYGDDESLPVQQNNSIVGGAGDTGTGQQDYIDVGVIRQDDILMKQMNASLKELENQKNVLSTSNGRMMELNVVLHDSILESIDRTQNLTNRNGVLQSNTDSLSSEVERLRNERTLLLREIQVLNGNVSGLFSRLEEHKGLNDQLEASILDLTQQNQILDESNVQYEELNAQLNESSSKLRTENEFLAQQNAVFSGLNTDLNTTAGILSGEVGRLEGNVNDLEMQNNRLTTLSVSLKDEVNTLSGLNGNLDETIQELNSKVDRLSEENSRLEVLTTELSGIASFLNETAVDANESFDEIANFLSEQITSYRSLILKTLKNTYLQRVANWDCSFRDLFSGQSFINNGAVPIPESIYAAVMNFIDDQILSDLCLEVADFENYLEVRFNERPTTMNHLISGVEGYTTAALDHYFPDGDGVDSGLTAEDWATAEYTCANLIEDQRFSLDESDT